MELVVALACAGLLVAVLAGVLVAHGRFAALQNAREDVHQNARAALELIAAELRALDPAAIAVAEERAITFRFPRAWGVVCHHTETRMSVLFPSAAATSLLAGDEFVALPPVGAAGSWQFVPVADLPGEVAAARAHCDDLEPAHPPGPGAAQPARMYAPRTDPGFPSTLGIAAGDPGLRPGAAVYLYTDVRYQASGSASAGWWIRRNTGPAMAMHPLAGPVPENGGLLFHYRDEEGTLLTGLSTQVDRNRIRTVEVTVTTQSAARFTGAPVRDSLSTRVTLRNPR